MTTQPDHDRRRRDWPNRAAGYLQHLAELNEARLITEDEFHAERSAFLQRL